jgi:hypothetical protein
VPVAKRNFRKRHKHGGEIVAGEDSGAEDDSVKKGIPSQIMASGEEAVEADALSSASADSGHPEAKHVSHVSEVEVKKGLVRSSMRSFEESKHAQEETAPPAAGRNSKDKISVDRKSRWAALLAKRPSTKDGDSMSNWLMEVLAVSDLETPLKGSDAADAGKTNGAVAKSAAAAGSDSPHSEAHDHSEAHSSDDDDESSDGEKKKKGSGVLLKKKRPAEFLSRKRKNDTSGEKNARPGTFAGGSFAEWKERKKQRKQSRSWEGRGTQPKQG